MIRYLKEIFAAVPKSIEILSITELAGTYTVSVKSADRIRTGDVVVIVNTPNFNGEHLVRSVSGMTFTIEATAGLAITTLGSVSNYVNFLVTSFKGAKNNELQDSYLEISQGKQMPLILCLTDISETENDNIYEPTLRIFLIENINKNDSIFERDLNEMEFLRLLEKDLKRAFELHPAIIDYSHSRTEIFFDSSMDKMQNQLTDYIDAIEIQPQINYLKLKNC
jgi:hypothetical protein